MFRPGTGITPRLILDMVAELPDTSATVASIRASAPPPAGDSPVVQKLRSRRLYRGWGTDRMLLVNVIEALTGKPYELPWEDDTDSRPRAASGPRPATTLSDFGM